MPEAPPGMGKEAGLVEGGGGGMGGGRGGRTGYESGAG